MTAMFRTRDVTVVLGALVAAPLFPAALFLAPAAAQEQESTCRAPGRRATLGETLCLTSPKGFHLARCEMDLNITSWTILDAPCPTAVLPDDGRTAPTAPGENEGAPRAEVR